MTDKMREAFEDNEFYHYKNPDIIGDILEKDEEGKYIDEITFERYELYKAAWQAAHKSRDTEIKKLRDALIVVSAFDCSGDRLSEAYDSIYGNGKFAELIKEQDNG